jgi:hypothetical protein
MLNYVRQSIRMSSERTVRKEPGGIFQLFWSCLQGDSVPGHMDSGNIFLAYPDSDIWVEEIYGPDDLTSKKAWKNFEHYKCYRSPSIAGGGLPVLNEQSEAWPHYGIATCNHMRFGVGGYDTINNYVLPFGEPGFPIRELPEFYTKRADNGFVPAPDILESLLQRAHQSMLPGLKNELSALNSLLELKDFKTLPRSLGRWGELLDTLPRNLKTLREHLRGGADGYLQAKFNVLPLLSDLTGIRAVVSDTERRVNDLLSREGVPRQRHWTFKWREFLDATDQTSAPYFIFGPYRMKDEKTAAYLKRSVQYSDTVFHCEIEYNYNFTQYQREHARMLSYLDGLGVNFNPQIIWNAIPWSFVVDWVINVSQWLKQFKVAWMEPQLNIRRSLWSVKRERRIDTSKHVFSLRPDLFQISPSGSLPRVTESSYRRQNYVVGRSSLEASGLTANEVSLGAALVIAQSRRRTKR